MLRLSRIPCFIVSIRFPCFLCHLTLDWTIFPFLVISLHPGAWHGVRVHLTVVACLAGYFFFPFSASRLPSDQGDHGAGRFCRAFPYTLGRGLTLTGLGVALIPFQFSISHTLCFPERIGGWPHVLLLFLPMARRTLLVPES